jgi:hypothetical protein
MLCHLFLLFLKAYTGQFCESLNSNNYNNNNNNNNLHPTKPCNCQPSTTTRCPPTTTKCPPTTTKCPPTTTTCPPTTQIPTFPTHPSTPSYNFHTVPTHPTTRPTFPVHPSTPSYPTFYPVTTRTPQPQYHQPTASRCTDYNPHVCSQNAHLCNPMLYAHIESKPFRQQCARTCGACGH